MACTMSLLNFHLKMYNGKSRHLGVRHSMIHELITNGVVSIEFVRSQQKLADHLTKGLARDLVIKSAEGMGLKIFKWVEGFNFQNTLILEYLNVNCTKLGRIVENLVQLWVQSISDNGIGGMECTPLGHWTPGLIVDSSADEFRRYHQLMSTLKAEALITEA
ncbi:hypothetical protein Tco_1507832 [Tanacetum coccineum]